MSINILGMEYWVGELKRGRGFWGQLAVSIDRMVDGGGLEFGDLLLRKPSAFWLENLSDSNRVGL